MNHWQPKLGLTEWIITIEIKHEMTTDQGDRAAGWVWADSGTFIATMHLDAELATERTLVHELLHVLIAEWADAVQMTGNKKAVATHRHHEERLVRRLTKILTEAV